MPFTSKTQMAACFAKKSRGQAKGWNCKEWAAKTDTKSLPEHVKKSSDNNIVTQSFIKLAKHLFNANLYPPIKASVLEARETAPSVQDTIIKRIRSAEKSQKAAITQKGQEKKASIIWNLSTTVATWE